jgi:hypothetical protein
MKKIISIKEFVKNNPQKSNLVVLKVEPAPTFCCCSGCVSELWTTINEEIYPQGPIEHEGSAILNIQNEQIILEQHESGPEIIAFLNSIINIFNFIKWLFSLSINAFKKKGATRIRIVKRIITTEHELVDESILEIDLKQGQDEKELDKTLSKLLNKIILCELCVLCG